MLRVVVVFVVMCLLIVKGAGSSSCQDSDERLSNLKRKVCASLVQAETSFCGKDYENETAKTDWPNQAVYMEDFLDALVSEDTCLNTSTARDLVSWLDDTQSDSSQTGNFAWTWQVFQVQYYDMPRKPGTRIESPDTLGRKCWAFAYLAQIWPRLKPLLNQAMSNAGHSLEKFTIAYDNAIPLTMNLCKK